MKRWLRASEHVQSIVINYQERPKLDPVRMKSLDFEAVVEVILFQWGRAVDTFWYARLGSSIFVDKELSGHFDRL
jgi:hypothetical protein